MQIKSAKFVVSNHAPERLKLFSNILTLDKYCFLYEDLTFDEPVLIVETFPVSLSIT